MLGGALVVAPLACGGLSRSTSVEEDGAGRGGASGRGGSGGTAAMTAPSSGGGSTAPRSPGQGGDSGAPGADVLEVACIELCDEGARLSCAGFSIDACSAGCVTLTTVAATNADCTKRMVDFVNCAYRSGEPCDVINEVVPANMHASTDCEDAVAALANCLAQQCSSNPRNCP
jgi:hypothetical protein